MRYKNKTKSIRVVLLLIVGLTTSLFVLSLSNALNAEGFTSHKKRFRNAKPVTCGVTLEYGHFELTGNLNCNGEDPAIKIIGPAKLNLNGYTLSGNEPGNRFKNVCIQIEGDNARVWNGTVMNCKEGILIVESEIKESDRNKVIDVKACNNRKRGFKIEKGNENLLFGCLAKDNGEHGFKIEKGDDNKIYFSKAIANCRDGIEIDGGSYNWVFFNHVEGNGNEKACEKDFTPWYFAGIDITAGSEENPSEYNKVKYNHACGNLGCNGSDVNTCEARERNYWDENVNNEGNCASLNEWENNTVCPECTPGP